MSMESAVFTKTATIFNTKQFFCSAKSRLYVSEAIFIATKFYPITLLSITIKFINSRSFSMGSIRECTNRNNCQFPLTAHFWIWINMFCRPWNIVKGIYYDREINDVVTV